MVYCKTLETVDTTKKFRDSFLSLAVKGMIMTLESNIKINHQFSSYKIILQYCFKIGTEPFNVLLQVVN